ncbi:MAG: hypothetical protein IPM82_03405 [Saprospiraceae bacterium]|nr:hypothetical protein [Saprospiraceae bacterium]
MENPTSPDAFNIVNGIVQKGADELWVSTQDQGLAVFNKKTEQFYYYNRHPAEYPDFPISVGTPLLDNQGNLWVSVPGQLMRIRLKDKQFHFHPVKSARLLINDDAYLLTLFDDREGRFRFIGMPSGDGLQVVDKKTGKTTVPAFVNVPKADENSQMVRGVMQTADGTIWVLGRHILYRFNPQTMRLEVPAQPPVFSKEFGTNYYTMMAEDGQGNIWLGTAMFGLFRYNPRTGEATHFMPDEKKTGDVPTNVVGVVHADGTGRLWYASRDRTAYGYFNSEENRFVYLDVDGKVTSDLASMRINNYFTDQKGNTWAFTERGIYVFDCAAEQPRLAKKYTVENGLLYDYVTWGVGDDSGNLWLINGRNLCRMNLATERFTVFGKQDGYPPVNAGIGKFANGSFYLRGFGGYYTFNADSLRPYESQAPIVLTSFKVNDQEQYPGSELAQSEPFVVTADGRYFSWNLRPSTSRTLSCAVTNTSWKGLTTSGLKLEHAIW